MSDRDTHAAIEPLDAATVERIAAGEVVERPASVVKELVENSLDAGATRIGVAVENGGKDGIRVRDNGAGIPASELSIAVEPHTTSKIDAIDDLESGIGTLGFRGEALSTIAAVSKLTLRSKPHDESVGAQLTVEGGDAGEVRPAGCPAGTTVEVSALFYNTPARKKFLKRDATEFDHVNTVLTQYALANPDVAVSLEHNDRELFATSGSGDLRAAVLSVYGRDVAESMLDLEATFEEGPIDRIYGLVSDPETTRSNRQYLATFVNDRYVTDSVLRDAVIDAYGGQLAADRYPFAVLFVELPPETVDVNVHPRKLEVRFDDEPAVERSVRDAVSRTLVDEGLIRSSAPRGRSAPAETQISPEWSIDGSNEQPRDESNAKPIDESNAKPIDPSAAEAWAVDGLGHSDRDPDVEGDTKYGDGAFESDRGSERAMGLDAAFGTGTESVDGPDSERVSGSSIESTESTESTASIDSATEPTSEPSIERTTNPTEQTESTESDESPAEVTESDEPPTESTSTSIVDRTAQRTLAGEDATEAREYDSLPSLRVLGQLYDTYVVAESDRGLLLIDQHAADERVNYERLQRAFDGTTTAQALASPVELELTAREAALFDEYADELAAIGFGAERIDDRWIRVGQVPTVFDATLEPSLVRDVVVSFVESAEGGERTIGGVADELLADLACYPAVTGNTSLTEGSVVDLLEALDECANPYACPHGRPTIIEFDREDIEDRFERDYPGHAGQRRRE